MTVKPLCNCFVTIVTTLGKLCVVKQKYTVAVLSDITKMVQLS